MFTLEALQANDGDCLLLHYGSHRAPRLILIDGGPRGIYKAVLRRRLEELRPGGGVLALRLAMVSHIDLDHITGVLDLFRDLYERQSDGRPAPYRIESLWLNSFQKLAGAGRTPGLKPGVGAVVASVKQGADLRDYALRLGNLKLNAETGGRPLCAPDRGRRTIAIDAGLAFTILGPAAAELGKLEKEWRTHTPLAADYLNRTIPNLSSIVALAERRGEDGRTRRMLLTGDAGGDLILRGLESAGLLERGRIHLDLLKVQHHGSPHSVDRGFFERVTADRYLISGDGRHGNPSMETLEWLSAARAGESFRAYFTNRKGRDGLSAMLSRFLKKEADSQAGHRYFFRDERALSIRADLEP